MVRASSHCCMRCMGLYTCGCTTSLLEYCSLTQPTVPHATGAFGCLVVFETCKLHGAIYSPPVCFMFCCSMIMRSVSQKDRQLLHRPCCIFLSVAPADARAIAAVPLLLLLLHCWCCCCCCCIHTLCLTCQGKDVKKVRSSLNCSAAQELHQCIYTYVQLFSSHQPACCMHAFPLTRQPTCMRFYRHSRFLAHLLPP
jgi:hypothetical protein